MAKKPTVTVQLTDAQKAEKAAARAAEKSANFLKLAPPRMTKAIKAITMIGNLGARNSYGYTDDQVNKMRDSLNEAVKSTMAKFASDAPADKSGFTF